MLRIKEQIQDDRGFVIGAVYENERGEEVLVGNIPEIVRRRRSEPNEKAA